MHLTVNTKKIALFSILLALAIILQAIENIYLPVFSIPGVKIGIANIVILIMLGYFSIPETALAVLLRIIIASIVTGTLLTPSFYFSLSGGILSFIVMAITWKLFKNKFSLTGVAVAGSAAHQIGQIMVAYLIMKEAVIFTYLPVAILFAVPFGVITGMIAAISLERLSIDKSLYSI